MLAQIQPSNYVLLATKINLSLFFTVCYMRSKGRLLLISLFLQASFI